MERRGSGWWGRAAVMRVGLLVLLMAWLSAAGAETYEDRFTLIGTTEMEYSGKAVSAVSSMCASAVVLPAHGPPVSAMRTTFVFSGENIWPTARAGGASRG